MLAKNEAKLIENSIQRKHITINTLVYEKNNKIILKRTIEFKSNFDSKRCVDISTFDTELKCTDVEFKTSNLFNSYE